MRDKSRIIIQIKDGESRKAGIFTLIFTFYSHKAVLVRLVLPAIHYFIGWLYNLFTI